MYTSQTLGALVRSTRNKIGITQEELALVAGTRARFVSDLENGKATCQLGKTLIVLQSLGIRVELTEPPAAAIQNSKRNRRGKRV